MTTDELLAQGAIAADHILELRRENDKLREQIIALMRAQSWASRADGMRKLRQDGMRLKEIAAAFGVSDTTVRNVIMRDL